MEEKIKEIIALVLGVSINEIEDDTAIGDISSWDSLRHVSIIAELESYFKIKFNSSDLMNLEDVSDIISLVRENKC